MSRIWFLADTHFGFKNDNDMWLGDFTGYFNEVVLPLMEREHKEGDILVHLGDVFDNRSTVGLNTICSVIDIFDRLSSIFGDIRIVIGNHDIFNKSTTEITSVRVLERIPGVRLIYEPCVEELGGKKVLFNPWVNLKEEEDKVLGSVDVDYIFGHLDVAGCQLNRKGVRSMSENSIESKSFKNSVVYAGHIHRRQDYGNVHYVGSPYQTERGDIDNVKGITVLDIETGDTEFFENTYSPKFKSPTIYEILDKTVGDLKDEWRNCFVDLHVRGCDLAQCRFDALTDSLAGVFKEFSVRPDNTEQIIDVADSDNGVSEMKTSEEYVKEWLKDNDIDGKRFDKVVDMFKKYKEEL